MSKHTAGPWGAEHQVVFSKQNAQTICVLYSETDGEFKDCEANAQLIASAPELLEALEQILSMKPTHGMNPNAKTNDPSELKVGWNVHTIARNAIAKARGEANG